MTIHCVVDKSSISVDKQQDLLARLKTLMSEEYVGEVVTCSWGDTTSFTNTEKDNEYIESTLPLKGIGVLQNILIFD